MPITLPKNIKIANQRVELRGKLWPDVAAEQLWNRKTKDGYTSIPRTMPLILSIMDSLSTGKPLSGTYLELWCRAFDEMMVDLSNHQDLAFASGFGGQRAKQTWTQRIQGLADLGFIKLADGSSGPLSHALILNPYLVVKSLKASIPNDRYNALLARANAIGASDL
ncbi:MAG TPA: hypothetical protein VGM54_01265 [Chthoniobacter sp.]|jgi:hypothetical protein